MSSTFNYQQPEVTGILKRSIPLHTSLDNDLPQQPILESHYTPEIFAEISKLYKGLGKSKAHMYREAMEL